MKIRKSISFVLAFFILISSMSIGASAFGTEEKVYVSEMESPVLYDSPEDMKNSLEILEGYVDTDILKERVLSGISECSVNVVISDLNIPVSCFEYVADFVWYNTPEAFNVNRIGCTYSSKINALNFEYRDYADTKDEYTACFSQFISVADKLLSGIENNIYLSDVEKALLLHDRLCMWTQYDYVTASDVKHTAYGAFGKRAAVCQGYAMAYMYLLQRVGIDNYYCSSDKLNHGWNIVYINNKPYHVDVTWDDRAWGSGDRGFIGRVDHDNFLRSTAGIKETGHTAYDFDSTPADTAYDSYFWQNSSTAFQLVDNEIYYIDNTSETLNRLSDKKVLLSVSDEWRSPNGGVWVSNFACLSSAGGELFYSLADGVYKYTVSTSGYKKIYSPQLSTDYSVFGFVYEDGYLICDINNTPNDANNLSQKKYAYSDIIPSVSSVEIYSPCTKTEYYIGDSIDLSGLKLKVSFSDSSYEIISSGFTSSGFSSKKAGNVSVSVSYKGYSDSFNITVKTPSVTLSEDSITLTEKEAKTLSAVTLPAGLSVSWKASSSNASVTGGKVTAVKMGNAVITAEITYNGISYSDTCKVNVLCGHSSSVTVPAKAATCVSTGYTAGVYCNDCKTYTSGHSTVAIDKNAHSWNKGTLTSSPDCISEGVMHYVCGNNSSHTKNEGVAKDSSVHNNTVNTPAVAATCSSVGYTAGVYCNNCKAYISGHKEIAINASAHKWDKGMVTVTATCSVSGVKTYTCEYNKSHTYTEDLGLSSGNHVNKKNIQELAASCTDKGYTAGVFCDDCKKYISGHEEIPAIDHKNKHTVESVTPNCTVPGCSAGVFCPDCRTYLEISDEIPVNPDAHKWNKGEITTEATCSVKGVKTFTCEHNGNHTYTEDMGSAPDNHVDTKNVPAVPATADSVGYTEGVYCNDCEKYISGHKEIPKLKGVFTESESACINGEFIMFNSGLTVDEMLKNASEGSIIKDKDGKTVSDDTIAVTGMTLILPDGKEYSLACPGDVNSDGKITAADARFVLRASVGLEAIEEGSALYTAANVNGDTIAASDARLILRASVGLEDHKKWTKS